MSDSDFLLTDEYVEYTQKIAKLHTTKKSKEEEMKKLYDAFKLEMASIEDEAKKAHDEWLAWKLEKTGSSKIKSSSKKSD